MIERLVIPTGFLLGKSSVDWQDVLWGFQHKILGWKNAVEFAQESLAHGSVDPQEAVLASLGKADTSEIREILIALAAREDWRPKTARKEKWIYLTLAWLFEIRETVSNPLACIEELYSDFDYPDEMIGFVGYMPPQDGYDPAGHSLEENRQRLLLNWERYLVLMQRVYDPAGR